MKDGINKIAESKSRTFLSFCFSFILGVGFWSWSAEARWAIYLYSILFLIILLIIWNWKNKFRRFVLLCLVFFCIGALHFLWSMPDCASPQNVCFYNGNRIEIIGWICMEPTREISLTKYGMPPCLYCLK